MNDLALIRQHTQIQRAVFVGQLVERRLDRATQQQQQGMVQSYSADQGWEVKLLNGSIVLAESYTTAGFGIGDSVVVIWDSAGRAVIDSLPV